MGMLRYNMFDRELKVECGNDINLPRRKPSKAVGFLLVLLALFFTFHNSKLELPTNIEPSSIGAPAPLKAPAIEASHGIKFVSRAQGAFKVTNGGNDDDADTSLSKYVATFDIRNKLLKPAPVYQACAYSHYQHFYTGVVQPRAPPVDLT